MLFRSPPYTPAFDGEILYMPFDGDYRDQVEGGLAAQVGTPGFAGSGFASSNAYQGTTDSYITFPSNGLQNNELSAAFWYKVNSSPDRAGLLVVGDDITDRNQGFRLFREGTLYNCINEIEEMYFSARLEVRQYNIRKGIIGIY